MQRETSDKPNTTKRQLKQSAISNLCVYLHKTSNDKVKKNFSEPQLDVCEGI